jgi:lipopolysaccharide transport system permease protein
MSTAAAPDRTLATGRGATTTVRGLPVAVIRPTGGWAALRLGELWKYRELLYFLVWRDVKVRYKQTILGAAWAVLQPLLTMIIFTLVFSKLAKIPSEGVPYPIFAYCALVPWTLFAFAMTESANSLVGNQHLVTKVYFSRLVIPVTPVLVGLVDFSIAFVLLLGMMAYYGVHPGIAILTLPFFLLLAIGTALGMGFWLSALNVEYRDVRHTVPFLIQFWLFASPIAYPSSAVPAKWRMLYGLNPIAGVVEGFRWALLGTHNAPGLTVLVSSAMVVLLVFSGLIYFRHVEKTFADVV